LVITCIEQGAVVTREAAEEAAQRTCVDVPDAVIADAVLPDTKTSEPATGKVLVFPRSRTVEPVSPPDPPSREQPAHFLASLQAAVFELASSLLRRWRPSAMLSGLLIAGGIGALLGLMIEGVLQAPVEPPVFPAGDAPVTATAEVSPLSPAGGVDIATSESAEPETGASETAVSLSSGQEVSSSVLAAGGDAPVQSQPGTAASVQSAPAQYARQTESALELFAMLPHVRFDAMTSWPDKRGDGSVELSAEAVASEGDVAALVPAQDLLVDQAADRVGTGRVEIQDDRAGEQSEEIAEHVSPAEFVSLEQRVATLVERARVHEREGRYVEPVADNALDLYREVLGLDAGNDRALQGIAVIKQLYLSRAESAELRSEWALAETSYRTASRIDPRDDGVLVDLARVSELKRGEDQAAARLQQNQQTTRRLARERLAELGLEPNARSLLQAAHVGDLTAADLLLAAGVSPDVVDPFTGTTPLIAAAMRGRTDIVLSLAQADASIDRRDAKGRTATMWAVDNSHAETVSLLLALGADAETRSDAGETLLMYSAWNGDVETSRILLDSGADASAASRSGWTALMNAAISGHAEIVELLLQRTADVNARNSEGRTALMAAASNGHTQIVRLLLSKAADVSLSKTDGWTALMYAAWNGHSTIVALLVAGGAQVDAANKDGWTALMYAAWNGHTATVSTLLAARADPQRRNRQGRTALMEARDQGHREVVKMLLSVANRVSANLPDAAGLNLCADDRIVNCDLLSDSL
jgi:ankyrin repeat protein